MSAADEPIQHIVSWSQIPSRMRRNAVLRELRSHVEDFMLAAREAGHPDAEVQRLVLASFGDPRQIACGFACVYRHERMMLRISAFVLSTLAVAILFSGAILTMQAGVAIGFGIPVVKLLASRDTVIEVLDIVFTAAAYVGLISLEKLFERQQFQKATAWLTLTFAARYGRLRCSKRPRTVSRFWIRERSFLQDNENIHEEQDSADWRCAGLFCASRTCFISGSVAGLSICPRSELCELVSDGRRLSIDR